MKTFHELVADKLEGADASTRDALLRIPLDNIERWLARGYSAPHRLEQWRTSLLRARESLDGFHELLRLLRDEGEAARRLRDFGPFAGVLTREERRQAKSECACHF
jgi:hypothetical protein